MLVVNYKDYIHENMIDEIALAKLDKTNKCNISDTEVQNIILPENFKGDFYIVYNKTDNKQSEEIEISESGIGISNKPDLLQLFNSQRRAKFSTSKRIIPILNPNQYGKMYLKSVNLEKYKDRDIVIIQHGINQSGRKHWNEQNNYLVNNNINIEYFECITIDELKKKYDL